MGDVSCVRREGPLERDVDVRGGEASLHNARSRRKRRLAVNAIIAGWRRTDLEGIGA